eukprot:scaffold18356_cov46-Cyclotella_meneghiniana.AAC.1
MKNNCGTPTGTRVQGRNMPLSSASRVRRQGCHQTNLVLGMPRPQTGMPSDESLDDIKIMMKLSSACRVRRQGCHQTNHQSLINIMMKLSSARRVRRQRCHQMNRWMILI